MATLTHLSKRKTEHVAVLLNANARAVDEKVRQEIARFVPEQDVYYSRTFDEAREIVSTVLEKGYTTLLTGGGDGTFVGYVSELFARLESEEDAFVGRDGAVRRLRMRRELPKFGVLRLGTGNSLAGLTGASSGSVGVVEDILRARSGDVGPLRTLNLIEHEGKVAPFAGVGLDAKVLNDYVAVKKTFAGTPFAGLGTGHLGYFLAVAGRSIPSVVMQRQVPKVRIVNEGAPAVQVAPDGRAVGKPIATGEVIYEGDCRMAACGTVPHYGYGLTMFPHALKAPGKMQLRVTAMSVSEILGHLPQIWKGRTPTSAILDFHADKVRFEFDRDMPLQVGGDAEGYRRVVSLAVDPRPVQMLDFKARA